MLEKTMSCQKLCFRLRNDLYCVGWGVKLYSLTRQKLCCSTAYIPAHISSSVLHPVLKMTRQKIHITGKQKLYPKWHK